MRPIPMSTLAGAVEFSMEVLTTKEDCFLLPSYQVVARRLPEKEGRRLVLGVRWMGRFAGGVRGT